MPFNGSEHDARQAHRGSGCYVMTDVKSPDTPAANEFFGHARVTVVEAGGSGAGLDLRELWAYRELVRALVTRDIRVRYKQTVLGASWAIIQPLIIMVIFSVIFGRLAGVPSDDQPYPLFVYCALLAWNLFANGVSASSQSLVGSASLVSKVYFPRILVPMASLGAVVVDFLVASVVLIVLMAVYDTTPGITAVLIPFLVIGVLLLTLAVGLVLAALTVSYRDFRFVVPFMLQVWMFLTPVVYASSLIPDHWRWLLLLNPMAGYVDGLRSAFLDLPVDLTGVAASVALTVLLLAAGIRFFQRAERRFADTI